MTFKWYDGGNFPPSELAEKYGIVKRGPKQPDGSRGKPVAGYESNGSLLIGEKGALYLPGAYGDSYKMLPEKDFEGFTPPPKTLTRSPGHMKDWIEAAKNGTQACSNFGYASALTGMVLLGNLALRAGKKIEWDAAAMRAPNAPECDAFIKPEYRKGWSL